jgi:cell division protein FtsI (penicillin-binding protein 3)
VLRGRTALVLMIALLAIAGVKLVVVQTVDAAGYAARGEEQRTREITLYAQRGPITDRNGTVLAFTVEGRALAVRPLLFRSDDQRAAVAAVVLNVLNGTTVGKDLTSAALVKKMQSRSKYVYLVRGLTPEQGEAIIDDVRPILIPKSLGLTLDQQTDALNAVVTERQDLRQYPQDGVAETVVGRTGWDTHGLSGVENRFDAILAGQNGSRTVEVDSLGRVVPGTVSDETPAQDGTGVHLTLDANLQYTTQQLLQDAVTRQCAKGGDAVVMGARDGQIYAMTSISTTLDAEKLGNRALLGPFEPGSVNKVVTMAAALERGIIKPTTVLSVDGEISTGGVVVHDAWPHGTIDMTATGILAKSSNVGTLMIANKLGEKAYYTELGRFGLGQKTGIELSEDRGVVPAWNADPAKSQWTSSTFANLPIGQGLSMTMLQLAGMYQAIANDGVRVRPSIIASTSSDGATSTSTVAQTTRVMSATTAHTLLSMLGAVVQDGQGDYTMTGTAPKAAINGYLVAGKTGTAQQVDPKTNDYSDTMFNSTFAGIVPADNPKYVIAIRLDAPCTQAEGGTSAAPLFHQIAQYAMDYSDVPPSTKTAKRYTLYVNTGG